MPLKSQAGWAEHAEFINSLERKGIAILGGPLTGTPLRQVACTSENAEQLRLRLLDDPWVIDRHIRVKSIEPWQILLGKLSTPHLRKGEFRGFLLSAERVPGPGWRQNVPVREQPDWDIHASFMDRLAEDRTVLLGGPVGDGHRFLLAFNLESEDEVLAALSDDPWAESEILDVEHVQQWEILIGSLE